MKDFALNYSSVSFVNNKNRCDYPRNNGSGERKTSSHVEKSNNSSPKLASVSSELLKFNALHKLNKISFNGINKKLDKITKEELLTSMFDMGFECDGALYKLSNPKLIKDKYEGVLKPYEMFEYLRALQQGINDKGIDRMLLLANNSNLEKQVFLDNPCEFVTYEQTLQDVFTDEEMNSMPSDKLKIISEAFSLGSDYSKRTFCSVNKRAFYEKIPWEILCIKKNYESGENPEFRKRVLKMLDCLDVQSSPCDTTVYRGDSFGIFNNVDIKGKSLSKILEEAKDEGPQKAQELCDCLNKIDNLSVNNSNRVLSTSLFKESAFNNKPVFWVLDAPAKTKGVFVDGFIMDSKFKHEKEFLVQSDAKIDIKKFEYDKEKQQYIVYGQINTQ